MEQLILVCDVCGKPAVRSITMRVDGKNLVIDLCEADTKALTKNARAPRRGRAAATMPAPSRRGRPKGSTSKSKAANGRRRKSTNGRRRRRKAASA
jgi:hypothetical protein